MVHNKTTVCLKMMETFNVNGHFLNSHLPGPQQDKVTGPSQENNCLFFLCVEPTHPHHLWSRLLCMSLTNVSNWGRISLFFFFFFPTPAALTGQNTSICNPNTFPLSINAVWNLKPSLLKKYCNEMMSRSSATGHSPHKVNKVVVKSAYPTYREPLGLQM